MKAEPGRRTFMESLLLGGPLLTGAAMQSGRSGASVAHLHVSSSADPIFVHVQQQFTAMLRGAKERGGPPTAEEAAIAAAYLRICGVHARTRALDDAMRNALQRRIAIAGRDELVYSPVDLSHVVSGLSRMGIDGTPRVLQAVTRADVPARNAALDAALAGKSTIVFDELAAALDAIAPRLPKAERIARTVQYSDYEWYCQFLQGQWFQYMFIAYTACNLAQSDPELQQFCETMWAAFMMVDATYFTYCPWMY